MYYQVIISGTGIFFENDQRAEPVIGFLATRIIDSSSEELAIATVKRDILVQWNQIFNTDRKLGLPRLGVERVSTIKQWIKPKISQDYYWFTSESHKLSYLNELEKPPARWFWRASVNS